MNSTFPRIITLLRKERGLSQKKAAADLNISQALLSHYEKGIRECGLDFVVRVANYYDVSCDYLLGRTADKSGTTLSLDNIPDSTGSVLDQNAAAETLPVMSKKLIINSLHILFDILQRCNNNGVSAEASAMLMISVYSVFRHICAANPKNRKEMFSIREDMFRGAVLAGTIRNSAHLTAVCSGKPSRDYEPLTADKAPLIVQDNLMREYPMYASSLFALLKKAESLLDDF